MDRNLQGRPVSPLKLLILACAAAIASPGQSNPPPAPLVERTYGERIYGTLTRD